VGAGLPAAWWRDVGDRDLGGKLGHHAHLRVASCGIFRSALSPLRTPVSRLRVVLSTDEPLTCPPGGFGFGFDAGFLAASLGRRRGGKTFDAVSREKGAARAIRARGRVGEDGGGTCHRESALCDDDRVQFQLGDLRQIVGQA
jgi:hypothetical protein